ncbi:redox-sensing transcriptional repressor Rex [Desulfobacca acetoxidans]|uniref:Redox-sensing transcriptional repressor Rex n=1 Tax=Desulfobacca acetoxidans (strain ATCC 700848 / DSM 11109 / ASRB2) TaxID=880072 RepID=F2NE57_DESAR|nr:redox-sensing transcriptional repressor Rex [Desulfobacca acetoxidans]AEB10687.1 Redox-sensing transcriptional repressor rex [Desulfobacca acetoxidans DSM 11109]HAY20766.1 redox-sensing transcriptional repressor Rex [Desulfobacterales bacterium]
MKFSKIPAATITRLSLYSRVLEELLSSHINIIASDKLAQKCGVNPAQVRKDLAYFGEFGVRGVGYFVKELLFEIKKILGLNRSWRMALIGIGNLGLALIAHENFPKQGYEFVAVFDIDPKKVGRRLPSGQIIHGIDELDEVIKEKKIEIGVIATPASQAQATARRLIDAGVKAILNFAPIQIQIPEGFIVENVDFTVKLDNLAYHLTMEAV